MGLFKNLLGANESLIRDDVPLSFEFIPKVLKFREREQRQFAYAIKPLLQGNNGRNLFVHGAPGVGKTVACKHVMKELGEETDKVVPLYVNCWKHNSAYKILLEICNLLGIRFIAGQKTSELFDKIKNYLNSEKRSAVFVFDEIDKAEELDVLYMVLEDVYRKSVFLITNYKNKVGEMDERIMSRLNAEFVEFKAYNKDEVRGILSERMSYAFVPGVWDNDAFNMVVEKTASSGDVRQGLFLMREAGNIAEEKASRKIGIEHVKLAVDKVEKFNINKMSELSDELKQIFEFVKKNQGLKMGELFQKFLAKRGEISYKTFSRKIEKLEKGKFIVCENVVSREGNSTAVYVYGEKRLSEGEKRLTEF